MRWSAAQTLSWIIQQQPLELKKWTTEIGPNIGPAGKVLASAIGADQVGAWGRRKRHGSLEQIPGGDFRVSALTLILGPHGELETSPRQKISTYEGPEWHDLEFDPDEIKKEWPKPPSPSANSWMMQEADRLFTKTRQPGKRDDMVQDCRKATNCTLRRLRGKPTKNLG